MRNSHRGTLAFCVKGLEFPALTATTHGSRVGARGKFRELLPCPVTCGQLAGQHGRVALHTAEMLLTEPRMRVNRPGGEPSGLLIGGGQRFSEFRWRGANVRPPRFLSLLTGTHQGGRRAYSLSKGARLPSSASKLVLYRGKPRILCILGHLRRLRLTEKKEFHENHERGEESRNSRRPKSVGGAAFSIPSARKRG